MSEHVQVISEPGFRFGAPSVNGIAAEAVAGRVFAGDPVDVVADDYEVLHRGHVLVACWYMALIGLKPFSKHWKQWGHEVYPLLAADRPDYQAIPDPPSRDESKR